MDDPAPLVEWYEEFILKYELRLSQEEIDNMPIEKYIFYLGLIQTIKLEEQKQIDEINRKNKRGRR